MVPSSFRLQAANVAYNGEACIGGYKVADAGNSFGRIVKIDNVAYYDPVGFSQTARGDGFVKDELPSGTCTIFRMSGLASAGGWPYRDREDMTVPDSIRGLYRVKDTLWMGSNGVGVAVYDLSTGKWSRYDLKSTVVPGDHLGVDYADNDYAFITRGEFPGASVHIYSVKLDKWLGLKAVSTKRFSEYGYTTGNVQVHVDHRFFARAETMPIDWTFMGIKPELIDNGSAYRISKAFSENKTIFTISKADLTQAFAAATKKSRSTGRSSNKR